MLVQLRIYSIQRGQDHQVTVVDLSNLSEDLTFKYKYNNSYKNITYKYLLKSQKKIMTSTGMVFKLIMHVLAIHA